MTNTRALRRSTVVRACLWSLAVLAVLASLALLACAGAPRAERRDARGAGAAACRLRLDPPEAFRLPKEVAELAPAHMTRPRGPLVFGVDVDKRWGVDIANGWRAFPVAADVESEVWTPTHRVQNTFGTRGGAAARLRIADRSLDRRWREVAGGNGVLFYVFEAFDVGDGSVVAVGLSTGEAAMHAVDFVTIDASGRASAPRALLRGQPPERLRAASAPGGTLALAWVAPLRPNASRKEPGSALWLARLDLRSGERLGPALEVDVDPTLDPDSAGLALAADGPGVALAWGVHSTKPRADADDRPIELRVFRQGPPSEAPRRAWTADLATRARHAPYAPDVDLPIPLDALSLDGRAVFAWRDDVKPERLKMALADGGPPIWFDTAAGRAVQLRSLAPSDARLVLWNWDSPPHQTSRLRCD